MTLNLVIRDNSRLSSRPTRILCAKTQVLSSTFNKLGAEIKRQDNTKVSRTKLTEQHRLYSSRSSGARSRRTHHYLCSDPLHFACK